MFRKTGLKKLALSCMLTIPLLLGTVSIGYCGGGAAEPPGDDEQYSGPALVGTLIVLGDDSGKAQEVKFFGHCGLNPVNATVDVSQTVYNVPDDSDKMLYKSITNGQSYIDMDACGPIEEGEPTGEDDLVINTVTSFEKCGSIVVADVVLLWVVPRNVP